MISYSRLLGSCARMLLSTCAYIITHSVSSSETRKEKPIITSGRDRQRDGPVTSARREQEDESSTRQTQPNRTQADSGLKRTTVNPAAEVQSAREDQGEEVPDTRLGNETAVVSNGTLDDITTKQAKVEEAEFMCITLHPQYHSAVECNLDTIPSRLSS